MKVLGELIENNLQDIRAREKATVDYIICSHAKKSMCSCFRIHIPWKEYRRLETLLPSGEGKKLTSKGADGRTQTGYPSEPCKGSTNWTENKLLKGGHVSLLDLLGFKHSLSWCLSLHHLQSGNFTGNCQSGASPTWLRLLPPDINVQWTTSWLKHMGKRLLCQSHDFVFQHKRQ